MIAWRGKGKPGSEREGPSVLARVQVLVDAVAIQDARSGCDFVSIEALEHRSAVPIGPPASYASS